MPLLRALLAVLAIAALIPKGHSFEDPECIDALGECYDESELEEEISNAKDEKCEDVDLEEEEIMVDSSVEL